MFQFVFLLVGLIFPTPLLFILIPDVNIAKNAAAIFIAILTVRIDPCPSLYSRDPRRNPLNSLPSMLFEKLSTDYQTWLESNGVTISPKIAIHDFRSTKQGRGIIAVEDIGPDEEIFRIPRESNVVLNANVASLFKEFPDLRDALEAVGPWETLIVCILYEFKKGKDSAWSPYFEALPFYSPKFRSNQLLYWNDAEIDALKPSQVVHRIGKEQAKAMYRTIKKTLHDHGFTEFKDFSLEDLYLVALLILSYSFDIIPAIEALVDLKTSTDEDTDNPSQSDSENGLKNNAENGFESGSENGSDLETDSGGLLPSSATVKSMIPLADTLNANTTLHNACLIYGPAALIMRSVQKIKKGDQVYNTYLEHPNSEILRRYGYVEEKGSKFDFGEVTLSNIKAILNKPLIDLAIEVAKNSDLVEDEYIVLVEDTYDFYNTGEVLPEFTVLLQYLTAVDALPEEESRELDEDSLSRILTKTLQLIESGKLTKNFKTNYVKILAHRLAEYGPVEFSSSDSEREKMAKIVLQSEIRSLKACFSTLQVYKNYKFVDDHKFLRAVFKKRSVEEPQKGLKRAKL